MLWALCCVHQAVPEWFLQRGRARWHVCGGCFAVTFKWVVHGKVTAM